MARSRRNQYNETDSDNAPQEDSLSNSAIAELLALAAEDARMPLQKALRRASRKAFMWPEEAALIVADGRSLSELPAVGPTLSRIISNWIDDPPTLPKPPEMETIAEPWRPYRSIATWYLWRSLGFVPNSGEDT